jgi:hypothetical protein
VFENGVLRKIFVPKRKEVIGDWRDYVKRNTVTLTPCHILWRRMGWTGHVVRIVEMHTVFFFAWQTRRKRGNVEDLSVDGRMILKWILMKQDGRG